jgi:hypothetical protein
MSLFLAPQTLQTRWLATSGTGIRLGRSRLPASEMARRPTEELCHRGSEASLLPIPKPCRRGDEHPHANYRQPHLQKCGLWLKR